MVEMDESDEKVGDRRSMVDGRTEVEDFVDRSLRSHLPQI